jgi:hypothetical protein
MPRAKRVFTASTIGDKRISESSFAKPQKVVRGAGRTKLIVYDAASTNQVDVKTTRTLARQGAEPDGLSKRSYLVQFFLGAASAGDSN